MFKRCGTEPSVHRPPRTALLTRHTRWRSKRPSLAADTGGRCAGMQGCSQGTLQLPTTRRAQSRNGDPGESDCAGVNLETCTCSSGEQCGRQVHVFEEEALCPSSEDALRGTAAGGAGGAGGAPSRHAAPQPTCSAALSPRSAEELYTASPASRRAGTHARRFPLSLRVALCVRSRGNQVLREPHRPDLLLLPPAAARPPPMLLAGDPAGSTVPNSQPANSCRSSTMAVSVIVLSGCPVCRLADEALWRAMSHIHACGAAPPTPRRRRARQQRRWAR